MKLKSILLTTLLAAGSGSTAFGQMRSMFHHDSSSGSYTHGGVSGALDDARFFLYGQAGEARNSLDNLTGARQVPGTDYFLGDAARYPIDAWREFLYQPGYSDGQPVGIPWPGYRY